MNYDDADREKQLAKEHALVRKAQNGDEKAFKEVMALRRGVILKVIRQYPLEQYGTNWEEVEQQIAIKVWISVDKFHFKGWFSNWLRSITVNHCNSLARAAKRRETRMQKYGDEQRLLQETAAVQGLEAAEKQWLDDYAEAIRKRLRNPIDVTIFTLRLRTNPQHTYEEISNIIERVYNERMSANNICVRFHRYIKPAIKLVKQLQEI